MATKIRLMRMGKIRTPFFRVVVTDSRKARNGLSIEEIGRYSPASDPSLIEVNSDRAQHWLKSGAQPTPAVEALLKVTGDWQKFKGLPGAEGTLKTLPPRADKRAAYETLYECLMVTAQLMAPIAPFFCDQLFRNLNGLTKDSTQHPFIILIFQKQIHPKWTQL